MLFISCGLPIAAQDFETLRPEDYPVGEVLPAFTTQLKLAKGQTLENTDVIVEYPEYTKLSSKEIKTLKKLGIELPERVNLHTNFATERKRGVVEVSFHPFLKKDGDYIRLTSVRVSANPKATLYNETPRSERKRYAENSVLATGKWVKIAVTEEGVYQITPALIKEWGFEDINRIKVYGYGGLPQDKKLFGGTTEPIDDLNEVSTLRVGDKILFFAEGVVRRTWNNSSKRWKHETNPYSKSSYYFVTEGEAPLTLQEDNAIATSTVVSEVSSHALYDEDSFAWYEGGKEFYDAYNFASGNTKTYTLATPDAINTDASLELSFSAYNKLSSTEVMVTSGEKTLGRFNIRYCRDHEYAIDKRQNYTLTTSGATTPIKFTTTQGRDARLNYLSLTYKRKLTANAGTCTFVPTPISSSAIKLQIEGATNATQVWRINEATKAITKCSSQLTEGTLSAIATSGKDRYVIVNTDANFATPTLVGKVENQNLHAHEAVHMVIIVPESGIFDAEAKRLAEAHELYSKLNVEVVRQDQIFNEFGSGTPDATALRRYMKMLYDRAESEGDMPRYLLLFGDGAFDNRMITSPWKSHSPKDYLLVYEQNDGYDTQSENVIGDIVSYPSDDYFGLLDDGEGNNLKTEKVDLGIGRFVCNNKTNAKTLVDKSIAYLQNKNSGSWKNRIVMIGDAPRNSDVGEKNTHMEDAERTAGRIMTASNGNLNVRRIYPDYYERVMTATGYRFPKAKEILTEEIKRGALMFNYSGHGSPAQISHSYILESSDWEKITSNALPIWVLASCEILPYDQATTDFGRMALFAPQGGAVAFMCASRAVYATENNALNVAFCDALVKQNADGSYNTFGDAMRIAKNALISTGQDRSINKLKYIIAGDPALRLMQPTNRIQIDAINGAPITEGESRELKAGSIATFDGYIENESDFNGILTATLYDKLEEIICRNNGNVSDEAFSYSERTKIVFTGSDSVRNGRFKIFIPIPRDISYTNESGRLSLYAVNHDGQKEANGFTESFHLNGTEEGQSNDTIGPKIFLYLNEVDFPNGGVTNSHPLFIAQLSDESGINATGTSLGHDLELTIDGQTSNLVVLNEYFAYNFGSYQEGTISYQLENLEPGRHTLSLRAWDHNNNSSIATLDFVVGNAAQQGRNLYTTINPARTHTQFVANIHEQHIGGTITFEVYTLTGQKVWENNQPITTTYATHRWNLTSTSGTPLPKGLYIFRAIITSEQGKEEIDGERLVII